MNAECGCGGSCESRKTVLLYACSGGANVAEAADRAALRLMDDGKGTMFCLAGLGAEIEGMVQTARDADLNVVIDGCPVDCAGKIFERLGVENVLRLRVTDLGVEKVKGVRATEEEVSLAVAKAESEIAAACGE